MNFRTRITAVAVAATVTTGAFTAPAQAWENKYDESDGNEGTCTLTFTQEEQQTVNDAYRILFEEMATITADKIADRKNASVWLDWAKANPNENPTKLQVGNPTVSNAQTALFLGPDSGTYLMAGKYLAQSRQPVMTTTTYKLTPSEAKKMKGAGAVNTGGLVAPGLWALIRGSLEIGDVPKLAGQAFERVGARIQPTISSYEKALTACENRETSGGTVKEGSSLKTSEAIGLIVGGILGGLALLGLIGFALGPVVNDRLTQFWRQVGVIR
ncbi:hypothetical protein [Corynebacterium aquatimens]|uniref:Secreted protein n=1 Tax=Corynebacterium aquatimens TaxID=1190508 RepID=A0A931GTD5_9CORY|nr:hypothetical protein [Corynebacterium aquatimens]MBG6122907.1 hypothetical protein [Corynebacterium aquatimens]WJY66758.1 hypothetical protein CAQUA_10355 [Corynebacterium aquatimens]